MYEQPKLITDFHAPGYEFLSNFYPCKVEYEGLTYLSSEAAFQAAKTFNVHDRTRFTTMTPGVSKKEGRKLAIRPDWDSARFGVMWVILCNKFRQHQDLLIKLKATAPTYLIEGNMWHDNTWGVCFCDKCKVRHEGSSNWLGKLLMKARD